MLALLASLALGQVLSLPNPEGPLFTNPATLGNFAFFELAPASGRGMGSTCACANPTGAKGETLTVARASSAMCSKQGTATTGIADGDLVLCGSNLMRVESQAGVLSMRLEVARTNSIQRSEEFNNAYWTTATGGAPSPGVPTITANAAQGPDANTVADRIDFPSTTGTGFSVVYNAAGRASTAAQYAHSLYVRGVSGSGTIYIMSTPGGSYNSTACAFVSTSWTRCGFVGTETAASWFYQIGFDLRDGAQTGQGAQSVYVYGAQGELGPYVSAYIPTTSAGVTRAADSPPWVSLVPASVATGSMSGRVTLFATATNGLFSAEATTAFQQSAITFGGQRAYVGGVSLVGPLAALAAGTHTVAVWWNGSSTNLILDGSSTAGAAGTPVATDRFLVGGYGGGNLEPGLYSLLCYDLTSTRCR